MFIFFLFFQFSSQLYQQNTILLHSIQPVAFPCIIDLLHSNPAFDAKQTFFPQMCFSYKRVTFPLVWNVPHFEKNSYLRNIREYIGTICWYLQICCVEIHTIDDLDNTTHTWAYIWQRYWR